MRRMLLALGCSALLVPAVAREMEGPTVADPLPFDHHVHAPGFARAGVACVDCHPVGLRAEEGVPELEPPRSSCHGCHLGEIKGAPRAAERSCSTCHPVMAELMPVDHGPMWIEGHGPEARARGATCNDCHDTSACIDCHESRGALAADPHPPAFFTSHGVEARIDPVSCSTCHSGQSCTDCHATGVIPW